MKKERFKKFIRMEQCKRIEFVERLAYQKLKNTTSKSNLMKNELS